MIGNSTEPHVSAPQCTKPEPKSAVIIPQNAATITILVRSTRKYLIIRNKFNIIRLMQVYTQISSCIRLPERFFFFLEIKTRKYYTNILIRNNNWIKAKLYLFRNFC